MRKRGFSAARKATSKARAGIRSTARLQTKQLARSIRQSYVQMEESYANFEGAVLDCNLDRHKLLHEGFAGSMRGSLAFSAKLVSL
jgi:hypothetical protein